MYFVILHQLYGAGGAGGTGSILDPVHAHTILQGSFATKFASHAAPVLLPR